jgi:hypothetical protein
MGEQEPLSGRVAYDVRSRSFICIMGGLNPFIKKEHSLWR